MKKGKEKEIKKTSKKRCHRVLPWLLIAAAVAVFVTHEGDESESC